MAQNVIPDPYDSLLALAEDMVDGLSALAPSHLYAQAAPPSAVAELES